MKRWWYAALVLLLAGTAPAQAQPSTAPPAEAAQFDFLVGQWEVEVTPKVSGLAAAIHGAPRLVGSWKAWRAFDGHGITDELRVVDGSGNPVALSQALRVYDGKARQWQLQTLDVYRARFAAATASWSNGEMLASGSATSPDGKPVLTRTRYYEITPERFRMRQDRSSDNGASWDEGTLTLVAKRIARAAPR